MRGRLTPFNASVKKTKEKKKQAKCVVGVSVFMVIAFPDIQPPMAEVMRVFLKRQQ